MLSAVIDSIAGLVVRPRVKVRMGAGTRLRWRSLLRCRGGRLEIGDESLVTPRRIDFDGLDGVIRIGNRSLIGSSPLVCRHEIVIGDDVLVSWGVTIVDHNSHALDWNHRSTYVTDWMVGRKNWDHVKVDRVSIGNKAWIEFGASILKGVSIGEGAVIGACSVVARDVPSFSVWAGNPARQLRDLLAKGEAS